MLRGMRWRWTWTWTIKLYRDYEVFGFLLHLFLLASLLLFYACFSNFSFFFIYFDCAAVLFGQWRFWEFCIPALREGVSMRPFLFDDDF